MVLLVFVCTHYYEFSAAEQLCHYKHSRTCTLNNRHVDRYEIQQTLDSIYHPVAYISLSHFNNDSSDNYLVLLVLHQHHQISNQIQITELRQLSYKMCCNNIILKSMPIRLLTNQRLKT